MIYCRKFLTLSNQTSRYKNKCIRIIVDNVMDKRVLIPIPVVNYFVANGDFYCLLISFANILDPDQDQQNAGDQVLIWFKSFDTLVVFLKEFFEKL